MKTTRLLLLVILMTGSLIRADDSEPVWSGDFAAATEAAVQSGRPLLVNFTGSDWCVWCHRLRDEVFRTPTFAKYAEVSLVLVELDFPRKKVLPPEVKQQNAALAEKYGVTGYPTVLLLTPDGKELARLGYMQGGPKTFVRELKRIIAAAAPR